jgi:hypothetical protein
LLLIGKNQRLLKLQSYVILSDLIMECRRFDWFWAGDGQPFYFRIARESELNEQPPKPGEEIFGETIDGTQITRPVGDRARPGHHPRKPPDVFPERVQYYSPYYYWRGLDEQIAHSLSEGKNIVVVGAPLSGKTRAVFEALRKLKPACDVLMPCMTHYDAMEFGKRFGALVSNVMKVLDPEVVVLAGEVNAFEELLRRYEAYVMAIVHRYVQPEAVEEVAQEVFITVYKSLEDFRGDSRFSTWLYRVTVNHCKNRIKYLGRRKYYQSQSFDEPIETSEGEMTKQIPDEHLDPLGQT